MREAGSLGDPMVMKMLHYKTAFIDSLFSDVSA